MAPGIPSGVEALVFHPQSPLQIERPKDSSQIFFWCMLQTLQNFATLVGELISAASINDMEFNLEQKSVFCQNSSTLLAMNFSAEWFHKLTSFMPRNI